MLEILPEFLECKTPMNLLVFILFPNYGKFLGHFISCNKTFVFQKKWVKILRRVISDIAKVQSTIVVTRGKNQINENF